MKDGERVTIQGSSGVYELSRRGEVYACTCPAWRAQKAPPARRTCKHLRAQLGAAHEDARLGAAVLGAAKTRARRSAAELPREPLEVRARRDAALAGALARFPAAAERMRRVYGMPLPRHLAYAAGFWLGLREAERDEAWAYLGCGLSGVAEWLTPEGLGQRPALDERLHYRYRRDPPEFVTVFSGNSDGGHWGLWYDEPRELPRLVAFNYARDDGVTGPCAPTLLGALRKDMTREEHDPEEWPHAARILAWLDEVHVLELAAHSDEKIGPPPPRGDSNIAGMDPVLDGVTLPEDLVGYRAQQARYELLRGDPEPVRALIAAARRELDAGRPLRALFLGRELHWRDGDALREEAGALLIDAYRAAGRPELAEVARIHIEHRDLLSVGVYDRAEPDPPLVVAAASGDLAGLRDLLAAAPAPAHLRAALACAREPAALDLLAAHASAELLGEQLTERVDEWPRHVRYKLSTDALRALIDVLLARGAPAQQAFARALEAGLLPLALELAERVDPGAADRLGITPLHRAAQVGAHEVVAKLLARGADRHARDLRGDTPVDRARDFWQRDHDAGRLLLQLLRPPEPAAPTPGPLGVGARVTHPTFGEGVIEACEGAGDRAKLTIRFADARRSLLARFVRALP